MMYGGSIWLTNQVPRAGPLTGCCCWVAWPPSCWLLSPYRTPSTAPGSTWASATSPWSCPRRPVQTGRGHQGLVWRVPLNLLSGSLVLVAGVLDGIWMYVSRLAALAVLISIPRLRVAPRFDLGARCSPNLPGF